MTDAPTDISLYYTSTHLNPEISAEALDGAELHGVSPHALGFLPWAPPEYPPPAGQDDQESGLNATQIAHAPKSNPTPSTYFSNGMPSYGSWDMAWSASQSNSQPWDTTMTPSSDYPDPASLYPAFQTEPTEVDYDLILESLENGLQEDVHRDIRGATLLRPDSAALAPSRTFPAPQAPQADHREIEFDQDPICNQSTTDFASRSSLAAAGDAETAALLMQENHDHVDGSSTRRSPLDGDRYSDGITGNTFLLSMPGFHPTISRPNTKSQGTTRLPALAPKPAREASSSTSTRPCSTLPTSTSTRKRKAADESGCAKIRKVHGHPCIRCKSLKQQVSC